MFQKNNVVYSFREAIGHKVVSALKRNDFGLTHAAIDMICALMHPMHDDYDLRQEQLNKSSLLQTKAFLENLLNMWTTHIVSLYLNYLIRWCLASGVGYNFFYKKIILPRLRTLAL